MIQTTPTRALIAAAAVGLFASSSAYAVQIDTFVDDQIVADEEAGSLSSFSSTNTATGSIASTLADSRVMEATAGTGDLGTVGIIGDGLLQYANTPQSAGDLLLSYLLNSPVDITDAGSSTGFLFTIEFADAPVDYQITVNGIGGGSASGTFPTGITGTGDAQDFYVAFNDFSGSIDFTSVNSIDLLFSPNNDVLGADLTLSDLRTGVPEPSSLALLALGGLAMMRRRRA